MYVGGGGEAHTVETSKCKWQGCRSTQEGKPTRPYICHRKSYSKWALTMIGVAQSGLLVESREKAKVARSQCIFFFCKRKQIKHKIILLGCKYLWGGKAKLLYIIKVEGSLPPLPSSALWSPCFRSWIPDLLSYYRLIIYADIKYRCCYCSHAFLFYFVFLFVYFCGSTILMMFLMFAISFVFL